MRNSFPRRAGLAILACIGLWIAVRYLLPIAVPFLLAAGLALAAEPLVSALQTRLRLRRGIAAGIGILIALVLAALVLVTLCALALRQLQRLSGVLPMLEDTALSGIASLEGFLMNMAAKAPDTIRPVLQGGVEGFFSDGTTVLQQLASRLLVLASGVVTRIPDGALGFGTWVIASFMISAKLPAIRARLKTLLPQSWKEKYLPALCRIRKNLGLWLLAQVKLSGITFVILAAGFFLLRIQSALLWAALICLLDALPVLGTGTALIPWALVCLIRGDTALAIGLGGVYAVVALLRSVLEPKLVGKQLGLDPLVTLIAMYAGFKLWGIPGMLFSPLLAVTVTQFLSAQTE